ncbi:ABC transporter permease [Roseovarius spongiae]|uniref:ABC transporter permease n=1 Tax=Roseovarius spongiae TaxID=2320272 RepID=A0A3A8ASM4_9RHOB|nr:ABC transporter permease [Roseovarius spongiae]RKF14172.1 ABC transporter permease [Roseovarius spongiae]
MPSGLKYLLTRLAGSLVTMLIGTMVVFFVMKLAPGDPALVVLGDFATPESIAAFNAKHGLDAPLMVQYLNWLGGLARLDFGDSLSVSSGEDIAALLMFRLPNTLFIGIYAILIAVLLSLVLGTLAAVNRGNAIDTGATSLAVLGVSMPDFWFGYMLILGLSIGLGLFPSYGFAPPSESVLGALHSGFLPALAIAAPMAAVFTRTLRTALIENLDREHVTVAKALGHPPRFRFLHHVFRNSVIPFIVVIGLQVRYLLGGVVIIERIFGINGVGSLMVEAAFARDYFVVQACAVVFLAIVLAVNYIVDLICIMLDPRRAR